MKTRFILTVALMMIAGQFAAMAQEQAKGRPAPEQAAQMKADKIAAELALDDKTSAQFKDTYKAYMADKEAIRKEFQNGTRKNDINDAEMEKIILNGFERRQKNLDLDRKYYGKFSKFMGPKLIQKMYMIEMKQTHHAHMHKSASYKGKGQAKPKERQQAK